MIRFNKRVINRKNWERLRNAQDQYDFWSNLVQPPQEGLEPLVGNFYVTPNEPVDPFDCERWSDSPYCGGNPFGEMPVGIDLNIVKDECNLGVQATGKLGFITLPSFQIVYRNPNCIPGDQREPPMPQLEEPDNFEFPPKKCERGLFINALENYFAEESGIKNGEEFYSYTRTHVYLDKLIYPDLNISSGNLATIEFTFTWYIELTNGALSTSIDQAITELTNKGFQIDGDPYNPGTVWYRVTATKFQFNINLNNGSNTGYLRIGGTNIFYDGDPTPPGLTIYALPLDYQELITFNPSNRIRHYILDDTETYRRTNTLNYRWLYACADINYIDPPPPPEENKNMACCPQNTQLLRLILKKIGSDNLPANVPTLLTRANSGTTQINNLAQFISYTVKQLDALCGKYPLDIEIEDIDLTQAGNQTQTLSIPNIAEALGEILSLLLLLRAESDANLSATVRSMIEAGQAKQAATLAVDYGAANAEFLGYKGRQIERELPMTFNPAKERLEDILKQTILKFKGWDNDDKNDINDLIAPILEMAAMFKAQNFRKTGASDPTDKLRGILRGSAYLAKGIDDFLKDPPTPTGHDPNKPLPPKPKDEFDAFLEQAEQGFIAQPGISDAIHPYSKDFTRRPKIREIGTDTSG